MFVFTLNLKPQKKPLQSVISLAWTLSYPNCAFTHTAHFVHTYNFSYLFACLSSYFCYRGRNVLRPEQCSWNWEKMLFLLMLWMFCMNIYASAMFPTPIPFSWLFSFLFMLLYLTFFLFFILFLCEWTNSGLPGPLSCLRYCFHIYPGILEKLIYCRKLSGSMLLVFRAYLLPLPFCCHSLNKLLQNIFENKGTKLH